MSTCETVMMTPAQAKVLRQTANFELQRPMSEHNVVRLRAEMDAGRFIPGTPVYFAELPGKSLVALNGNHTLEAIARGQGGVELTLIYQPVASQMEAAAIYSRFDLHKLRSWRDSLRAYGAELMLSDSSVWTSAYAAALGMMLGKFEERSRYTGSLDPAHIQAMTNRDLRFRLMREGANAASLYVSSIGGYAGGKAFFKRASVMGVGIEIMRYQPSAGVEFFSTAAADDGLRVGDPQRALLLFLRGQHSAGMAARILCAKAVAAAWNAFFQKRRVDHIKPGLMTEFRLLGTPWTDTEFDPLTAYLPELRKMETEKPKLKKIKTAWMRRERQ